MRNGISKKILRALLISGAISLALSSPRGVGQLLRQLPKELRKLKREQLRRALYNLRDKNFVKLIHEDKNNVTVELTENGRTITKKMDIDQIQLEKPEKWDKKWHLVVFDIPEKKKIARESLRMKLKDLGFKKFQHSIWITPFSCEKEINFIKSVFNLSDYWIDVIITENLGVKEYQFRKHFNLVN
ncbi:hypothetical protein KKH14_00645 [Patescibacteria group bacterium]|nr:hypothetical protein [Patescibacteria group bacterium]